MPILRRQMIASSLPRRGAFALVALLPLLAGCGKDSPTSPAIAGSILIEAGDGQSTVVGTGVVAPLKVHVLAQNGSNLAGAVVKWTAASTLGTLADSVSQTDAAGIASMTFAAGVTAGTLNISAATGSLGAVSFTQKLIADVPAAFTKFGGDGAASIVSGALPLAAKVADKWGNAVAGQSVTWTLGTQGGGLSVTTSTTDVDGLARTTFTLGAAPGTYTVSAQYGSFPALTFTVTGI